MCWDRLVLAVDTAIICSRALDTGQRRVYQKKSATLIRYTEKPRKKVAKMSPKAKCGPISAFTLRLLG